MQTILILNGPNLNRLGTRKPEVYGSKSMAQILLDIQRRWPELRINYFQSNHEGDLIDWIQLINDGMLRTDVLNDEPTALNDVQGNVLNDEPAALNDVLGIVLNAGGYSHTSVALRDAVEEAGEAGVPVVEVHISDIRQREAFRRESLLTEVCAHSVIGHGTDGYLEAVNWLLNNGERLMANGEWRMVNGEWRKANG
jgi:3-dehydroquinate dehydratase-2